MQGVVWFIGGAALGAVTVGGIVAARLRQHDDASPQAAPSAPVAPPPSSGASEPPLARQVPTDSDAAPTPRPLAPSRSPDPPVAVSATPGDEVVALRARLKAAQEHQADSLRAHRAERARLLLEIERLEATIGRLERRTSDGDDSPSRLRDRIAHQRAVIAEKEARVTALAHRVAELERMLQSD